jgi:hypothetical protein
MEYNGIYNSSSEMRFQLWSVNQQTTKAEEYPLLRFVTIKRLVKTAEE